MSVRFGLLTATIAIGLPIWAVGSADAVAFPRPPAIDAGIAARIAVASNGLWLAQDAEESRDNDDSATSMKKQSCSDELGLDQDDADSDMTDDSDAATTDDLAQNGDDIACMLRRLDRQAK